MESCQQRESCRAKNAEKPPSIDEGRYRFDADCGLIPMKTYYFAKASAELTGVRVTRLY